MRPPTPLRRSPLTTLTAMVLVALSGLLMVASGFELADSGWSGARPLALGGGLTIQTALWLERRQARQSSGVFPGRRRLGLRLASAALVATAGGTLVLVGHTAAGSGWWPPVTATVPAVLAVGIAMRLQRRAALPPASGPSSEDVHLNSIGLP